MLGKVKGIQEKFFLLSGSRPVHNGDGLCFMTSNGLVGFRVNRVDGNKIFPAKMPRLEKDIMLFRNYDHEFEKALSKKSAERKIQIDWLLEENNFGFSLTATDEDGCSASITMELKKEPAAKKQNENIREQLSKLGNTLFQIRQLSIHLSYNWFILSSVLSEMRRKSIEALLRARKIGLPRKSAPHHCEDQNPKQSTHPYPTTVLSYLGNVSNEMARNFYRQHGVLCISPAFEIEQPRNVPVMFTKHCLKYQFGYCCKQGNSGAIHEPWILSISSHRFELRFDCRNCEMQVLVPKKLF
jgi:putative protease